MPAAYDGNRETVSMLFTTMSILTGVTTMGRRCRAPLRSLSSIFSS